MQQFTHNNREILCVEVPEGATVFRKEFDVETDNYCILAFNDEEHYIKTPDYWDFKILGLATEITEGQAFELVDKSKSGGMLYTNYVSGLDLFFTATESLTSRILSLGMKPETTLLIEKNKTL